MVKLLIQLNLNVVQAPAEWLLISQEELCSMKLSISLNANSAHFDGIFKAVNMYLNKLLPIRHNCDSNGAQLLKQYIYETHLPGE
jgi:hypothetical protein